MLRRLGLSVASSIVAFGCGASTAWANTYTVSRTVSFKDAAKYPYVTGTSPPVAKAECQRSDTYGGDCPTSATGELIGDGTAPYLVCSADAYASKTKPSDTTTAGDDQTIACDWTVTIQAAATLVPVVSADRFSTYVPGAGTVVAAPADGATKAALAQRTATAARAAKPKKPKAKSPAFKRLTVGVKAAGPVTFKPVLSAASRATLKRTKKLKLRVRLAFTPQQGAPTSSTVSITLRKP